MLNIPTAAQAAQQATATEQARLETAAREVQTLILAAIKGGQRRTVIPGNTPEVLRTRLRAMGYKVANRQAGPNETETEVTW